MFWDYFLISYWRHKCFCSISVYFFTKQKCEYFFEETISVFFFKHIFRGINRSNSLVLRNQNISCKEHQESKKIYSRFVRKMRTGRRSNGGTGNFVWCETKPKQLSMLCMKFFYVVYENLSILCMTICLCCVWHIVVTLFCLYCLWH